MTAPTTPTAENIRPGQVIVVQGAISFARTASLIDGVELERRVSHSKSQYPTDSPHTLIALSQAEIVPADPTQYSWEESYVKSLFFEHKKNPEKGLGYEAKNVTKSLPTLLTVDPENPGSYRQVVDVEGEIARDTVVRIVVVTYQSKDKNGREYQKLGLGLEAIILSTPEVPYAPKSGARNLDLRSYGITLSTPLVATNGVESEVPNEIVRTDASGLPAAPVAPSAPVQPVAAPAPVASVAPAAPSAPLAPAAPVAPFQPAAAAPVAPAAPMAPVQPIVPVAAAYQVAAPGAPVAPAAGNPDDPFSGTPAPSWGGAGIQVPA
ncbi:hypothetical protein AB0O58_22025 [Rhodococcus sp. NPDC080181]|jgi:hypothetical protein|uniref:hypothetical protein n=1 Tax=Rhodococcus sp. NPDC080181 TaxID=3155292 RepID=UPI00344FA048